MRYVFSILAICVSGVSAAQERAYVSADGTTYLGEENAHGAVLQSSAPVSRTIGADTVTGPEVLYLGRSCDTFSQVLGTGSWGWANGGFCAEFPAARICFPRQDPPFETFFGCRY